MAELEKWGRYCAPCRQIPRCHSCEKVGGAHLKWCSLATPLPWPGPEIPRPPISMRELGWVAGFLEGEGCFPKSKSTGIVVQQVQREPLERLQRLFGGRVYELKRTRGNDIHQWYLHGPTARGLMMTLYTLMSPRRKEQIAARLASWRAGAYRGFGHRAKRATGYAESPA